MGWEVGVRVDAYAGRRPRLLQYGFREGEEGQRSKGKGKVREALRLSRHRCQAKDQKRRRVISAVRQALKAPAAPDLYA